MPSLKFKKQDGTWERVSLPGVKGDTGAQGPRGDTGAAGPAGANATINGVNALTIASGMGISATQEGSTLTIASTVIAYGTEDVTAGSESPYPEGTLYVVIE